MPAVEILLARQLAGKHTVQVGSLPVTFTPGAVMTNADDIATQMTFAAGVLSVPFRWCVYQIDNTDSVAAMIVQCASGDVGFQVLGGYTAMLLCDGTRVTPITTSDAMGYVLGEADAVASALGVGAAASHTIGGSTALGDALAVATAASHAAGASTALGDAAAASA